ncbi:MAG: lactoylglutathione lyase [Myxococcota bacterium]|jgi:lactoylglutathione lyase
MSDHLVQGIAHVGIRVHDLARSRAFYELLGFEFVVGPIGPEPVAIMKHPAGIELNFVLNASDGESANVLMDGPDKHPGITHIALRVRDLDEAIAVMADAGHPLSGGPIQFMPGHFGAFVRDPDRNVIELNYVGAR